jgi:hypothetical protein
MPGSKPELPEVYRVNAPPPTDFHVSEIAADLAGALSPFGDVEFPLPVERLHYVHPGPAERPNLAGA